MSALNSIDYADNRLVWLEEKYGQQIAEKKKQKEELETIINQYKARENYLRELQTNITAEVNVATDEKRQMIHRYYELMREVKDMQEYIDDRCLKFERNEVVWRTQKQNIDNKRILELHKEGHSLRGIANILGCAHNAVKYRLEKMGKVKKK